MPGEYNDNPAGYLAWLRSQMNSQAGLSVADQARLAKAEADAAAAKGDAATAKSDAASAATKANTAQGRADSAMSKADAAKTAADAVAASEALTSADRQQAVRVRLTPDANGKIVFVFPKEYATGVKPAVTTTAETPDGATYRNDASVLEDSATNKQVTILVQRIPKTLIAGALGAVLNLIVPVTTPVWINILVRAPI